MPEPLLRIRDLCKAYGALQVTDNISLDVAQGELHAIIGPNGAGKTTLIHQLSGSIASDRGSIIFDGQDITGTSMPERVHLGLARSFQITSVLSDFTVLENAALAVQARSGSSFHFFADVGREAPLNLEAIEALARVGLDDRANRLAGSLSHGEKRQLELAIALATKPRLLLLDEPLAGSGHEECALLIQLMRNLKGEHTIVLIEHDMDAVFALADRISVLVYGRLITTGSPETVRADPDVRGAYLGEEELAAC
jgi:branched-chain amino acid transport system ATP-binding protein